MALGADRGLRATLLALADPAHARIALANDPVGSPVDLGTLLRAFRLRAGRTQADLARTLGMTQSAVAHWEAGERTPDGATLHSVLFELGASAQEAVTLTRCPVRERPIERDPQGTLDDINHLPGPLRELAMLLNERDLWWRAVRNPSRRADLVRATVQRAVWYAFERRFDDSGSLLGNIRRQSPVPDAEFLTTSAAITLADPRIRPNVPAPEHARRMVYLASTLAPGAQRAWAQATGAVALAALDENAAFDLARQALDEALREDKAIEIWFRRIDLAEVCLRTGSPERALEALNDEHRDYPYAAWAVGAQPAGLAVRARALVALGQEPEPELMDALRGYAAASGAPYHRAELATVERAAARLRHRS